jgi:MerR family glutamine synthetase transcriptional repressor
LFSFNDVDRLLEIKSLLEKGLNIAGIKQVLAMKREEKREENIIDEKTEQKRKELSDRELREMLKQQMIYANRLGQTPLNRGELSRFFH